MKRIIFIAASFLLLFSACKQEETLKERIEKQEKVLLSDTTGTLDNSVVKSLVDDYIAYAEAHVADSLAPMYRFKSADILMNTGNSVEALHQLDYIIERNPRFHKMADVYFLKGYILENHLGELGRAKTVYDKFLAKYPEHEFADDVRISLRYLGRSPEELIKEFEKRNQAN